MDLFLKHTFKPYIDSNSDNRLYFILVNSDEEMNEKLLEMYK